MLQPDHSFSEIAFSPVGKRASSRDSANHEFEALSFCKSHSLPWPLKWITYSELLQVEKKPVKNYEGEN